MSRPAQVEVGEAAIDAVTDLAVSNPLLAGVAVVRTRQGVERAAGRLPHSATELRRCVVRSGQLPDRVPDRLRPPLLPPALATDVFLSLVGVLFLLTYYTRFPFPAQVTVRYLLVLFPLGVYALARTPALRRVLHDHGRLALWSYLAGVLLGAQLLLTVVVVRSFGDGEAFQLHALVSLALAGPFALLALASTLDERVDRLTAVAGGLAAAAGTDFLLLSGVVYFQYGPYALPLVDSLADVLPV